MIVDFDNWTLALSANLGRLVCKHGSAIQYGICPVKFSHSHPVPNGRGQHNPERARQRRRRALDLRRRRRLCVRRRRRKQRAGKRKRSALQPTHIRRTHKRCEHPIGGRRLVRRYSSHSRFPRTAAVRAMRTDRIFTCFHYEGPLFSVQQPLSGFRLLLLLPRRSYSEVVPRYRHGG